MTQENKTANIITDRLILLPVTHEHTEDMFKYFDEKVIKHMYPGVCKTLEEMGAVVDRFMKQREGNTDYVYTIKLKGSGEFIGIAGLHNLNDNVPELGVWTKTASHGNHYGREAIGGVIKFAGNMGIKKLCYPVDKRNAASVKIPLFYGGKLVKGLEEVKTPDGRVLEEETYEIDIR